MSDEQQLPTDPTPPEETAPPSTPEPTAADATGWAAYDETLKRFVGPVVEKKPTAADLKKLGPSSHKITARKV